MNKNKNEMIKRGAITMIEQGNELARTGARIVMDLSEDSGRGAASLQEMVVEEMKTAAISLMGLRIDRHPLTKFWRFYAYTNQEPFLTMDYDSARGWVEMGEGSLYGKVAAEYDKVMREAEKSLKGEVSLYG